MKYGFLVCDMVLGIIVPHKLFVQLINLFLTTKLLHNIILNYDSWIYQLYSPTDAIFSAYNNTVGLALSGDASSFCTFFLHSVLFFVMPSRQTSIFRNSTQI